MDRTGIVANGPETTLDLEIAAHKKEIEDMQRSISEKFRNATPEERRVLAEEAQQEYVTALRSADDPYNFGRLTKAASLLTTDAHKRLWDVQHEGIEDIGRVQRDRVTRRAERQANRPGWQRVLLWVAQVALTGRENPNNAPFRSAEERRAEREALVPGQFAAIVDPPNPRGVRDAMAVAQADVKAALDAEGEIAASEPRRLQAMQLLQEAVEGQPKALGRVTQAAVQSR